MLLIVCSAGASYDSVPSRRPADGYTPLNERPPLANQLFDDRPLFNNAIASFPQCQPIVPYLRYLPTGVSLEQRLEELQAEEQAYPERHKQLAAVRYYLHLMLWQCQQQWLDVAQGITNYKTLLDEVERWREPTDRVCIVTFNYDCLIETALPTVGLEIRDLPDYITHPNYMLVKLHGSVNWGREVETKIDGAIGGNVWTVANKMIERAAELTISDRYRIVNDHPIAWVGETLLFPAITIPVETKQDFECPAEHLKTLAGFLPTVTKVLLIGWRASEKPFLQLLRDSLTKSVQVFVVASEPAHTEEPIKRLRAAGINGDFVGYPGGGFTEFVVHRAAQNLLSK